MKMHVVDVGIAANWTDFGREFAQVQGFCQSGACDSFHFQLANALCGNELDAPAIEVLAGQFSFHCDEDCIISVTGALAEVLVDSNPVSLNTPIYLVANQLVELKILRKGLYNYIAIKAQAELPEFYGSVCPVRKEGLGGTKGNGTGISKGEQFTLRQEYSFDGDNLSLMLNQARNLSSAAFTPLLVKHMDKYFASDLVLPLCLCYQSHSFSNYAISRLFSHTFTVSQSVDKMGVRLHGPSIHCENQTLQSQALALGSVQITGDGQAIIMRNERQTMGGYPIIGVVSKVGLMILSQAKPNDKVSFVLSDFEQASIEHEALIRELSQKQSHLKQKAVYEQSISQR